MEATETPVTQTDRSGKQSVQSVARVFAMLEVMADADGVVGISALADATGMPLPTVYRLIRTLVDLGYVYQDSSRQYVLGPRLIRLGERSSRMFTFIAHPRLVDLADRLGETVNLAMLNSDQIVYLDQAPSKKHSMRMFTEVGRRVSPHCTAVGKAIFATMSDEKVDECLKRTGMPQMTQFTITDRAEFIAGLANVRSRGYAVDEDEQEVGVHCVAVDVTNTPAQLALSVSGPANRVTEEFVQRAAPALRATARALAAELG